MTSSPITGGCQCGAVRYRVAGSLTDPGICHCRMCQKAFGAFFAPLASARLGDLIFTRGAPSRFKSSDAVERGFCRDCGTPLTFMVLGSDKIDVSIGSLDDPAAMKPVIQFGLESRMPWLDELFALPGKMTSESEKKDHYQLIARTNHQHPDHDTETWNPGQGRPA